MWAIIEEVCVYFHTVNRTLSLAMPQRSHHNTSSLLLNCAWEQGIVDPRLSKHFWSPLQFKPLNIR